MDTLEKARKNINEIDKQMAALFEERMHCVKDVVAHKMAHDKEVLDNSRERAIIENSVKNIKDQSYLAYYQTFIQNVMDISKQYQHVLINKDLIGYEGTLGSFSQMATEQLFKSYRQKAYQSFEEVFKAVVNGDISYGVIPFENSYSGEIGEVLDLLWKYDVTISKMYDMKISQNLLGLKGAKLSDIKQVYSKDQAIKQCALFLKGTNFETVPYYDTALAAKYVRETNDISKAAIASIETANLYDLQVLVEDINTTHDNTTRFVVIQKELKNEGNRFSLLFTVDHEAGQLVRVIQEFGNSGYNLESIKSRALPHESWNYYFYVEVVGELRHAQDLIEQLQSQCKNFKIIGSYTL